MWSGGNSLLPRMAKVWTVDDGVSGALKVTEAQHSKGKHRDSVPVQSYMNFYNLAKEYCPKVTLFHLSKEDEETTTEEDKP